MYSNQAYDYSDANREETIRQLFAEARIARQPEELRWKALEDFYHSWKDTLSSLIGILDGASPEAAAEARKLYRLTDGYIQVESQIDSRVPEPMFTGRDQKSDKDKAKQREYTVKYLIDRNKLDAKNSAHERTLRIFGDSFAKVYYDAAASYDDSDSGDICGDFINIQDFFPDPTAKRLDDCEYVDYVYYIHRRKAARLWGKEFKKKGIDVYTIGSEGRSSTEPTTDEPDYNQHNVQIIEHWYRDDEGDICLSMLVSGKEFKHVKKYWKNTGKQNKRFPFVHFQRIGGIDKFWGVSELEPILPICEIASQVLSTGIENYKMMSNDIIIAEEDALVEGEEINNVPGAVIMTKAGRANGIRRLGGLNGIASVITDIQFFQSEVQRTTRNYDTNMGRETSKVTTASGLAQIRADASEQTNIKDAPRYRGWESLFELFDWSALEFYDEARHIFIGTPENKGSFRYGAREAGATENLDSTVGNIYFTYNSEQYKVKRNERIVAIEDGANKTEVDYYYPVIDCTVKATNGIEKSKSFIIQTLNSLLQMNITVENYRVAIMLVRELGIPESEDIIKIWMDEFEPQPIEGMDAGIQSLLSPSAQQMARMNPMLLEKAKNIMAAGGGQQAQGTSTPSQRQYVQNAPNSLIQNPNAGIA